MHSVNRVLPSLLAASSLSVFAAWPSVALAAPKVVADILPVHSIAARVMQGVGTPELLVDSGASPHYYSMTPSDASALQEADVIFWIGDGLEPWLVGPLQSLPQSADVVELADADGVEILPFRESARFEHDHDHGHGEDHAADEHGHDDHDHEEHAEAAHGHDDHDHDHEEHAEAAHGHDDHDHDHEELAEAAHGHDDHDHDHEELAEAAHGHDDHDEHAHDDHGHDDHDRAGHAHADGDPHIWLDPVNAIAMAQAMAGALSQADPENASTYTENAAAFTEEMETLSGEVSEKLASVTDLRFIVFHDAYHYFEDRFGMEASGAIALGDASTPSAARVAEVRDTLEELQVQCVFSEPQFDTSLVETVIDGTGAQSAVLDPIGVGLEPGPTLYPELLRNIADGLAGCLNQA
ncbi:MAG: zinc ABC transporter substrate-binding protein [Pseudomonadota bacterium]